MKKNTIKLSSMNLKTINNKNKINLKKKSKTKNIE